MDKKNIIFLGDTHGDNYVISDLVDRVENYTIIHVGDVGLGFSSRNTEQKILSNIDNKSIKNKNNIVLIAGNHDSKARFKEFRESGLFKSIHFPKDYDVLRIAGKDVMFIGGAVSIDRTMRRDGYSYWSDEAVVFDKSKCKKIDIMVTHTAPSWCYPQTFNDFVYSWSKDDAYLLEDLKNERQIMDEIFKICKPSFHVYGHFHSSWSEEINGCMHKLLDINETWDYVATDE